MFTCLQTSILETLSCGIITIHVCTCVLLKCIFWHAISYSIRYFHYNWKSSSAIENLKSCTTSNYTINYYLITSLTRNSWFFFSLYLLFIEPEHTVKWSVRHWSVSCEERVDFNYAICSTIVQGGRIRGLYFDGCHEVEITRFIF